MKIKLLKNLLTPLSFVGAAVFFSYAGQNLESNGYIKESCFNTKPFSKKIICSSQRINRRINFEINLFLKRLKITKKGIVTANRVQNLETLEKFKKYKGGFDFSYLPEKGSKRGYFLLSRVDPDLDIPKIELWDLTKQTIIHSWQINPDQVVEETNIVKRIDKNALRFLHPLLLEDGSIIVNPMPGNKKTSLFKFNYCGKLTKFKDDGLGYHHSIETDKEGNIYAPTATIPKTSEYFANYKSFPDHYRNEGIAILNKDLELKEVIPLDKIFYSVGLLNYINSPHSQFKRDPYHLNDVHPYKDDNGNLNLLLSLRYFGLISYDYEKKKVNWISRGLTEKQHDITPYLGSKNIFTIFDNGSQFNHPREDFKGNTIVKIEFPKIIDETPLVLFGESPKLDKVKITRYDFTSLGKELVPFTRSEGRGRFIDESRIFVEETNNGRAFVFDLNSNKLEWSYINKGKNGVSSFLGWSRFLEEIPDIMKTKKSCT